jgi:alkaline phosphatase D
MTRLTRERMDADFMVVPVVSTPDSPAHVRASFAVEDRAPGLHQTYDRPLTTRS